MTWDEYFLRIAELIGQKSKDELKKTGALIVGSDNEILSSGFNGFPRGVAELPRSRHNRPAKYMWAEHAERNAIFNAARGGVSTLGTTMYLSAWYPCADCARAIIQAGISQVVVSRARQNKPHSRWSESCAVGLEMLAEAQVECVTSSVDL
jgi:dCMP deaminase